MTKKCSQCKEEKELRDYYKEKNGAQGVKGKCKECVEQNKKLFKQSNPQIVKKWIQNYHDNPETKENIRAYKDSHKEHTRKWSAEHRQKNLEFIRKKEAENRKKDSFKARRRIYCQRRYETDLNFRLADCLRSRMRCALKNAMKSSSTSGLTGCSIEELKAHLQSLFKKGMDWDNYGQVWHIDHILPCKMFHLQIESEQRLCFHYTNLQPMWKRENIIKGGTFDVAIDTLTSIYLLFEQNE